MQGIDFDHIEPQPDFERLPMQLRLTTSRASAVLKLMMLAPMMVVLALPLTLIGARAIAEPSPLTVMADNPVAALQMLAGLLVWAALFLVPLQRIISRMGASRLVHIEDGRITVADRSPFASSAWSEPLAAYRGVAHHIRAGLSGNRHELVLVHADRDRNVTIAIADRITQASIDKARALLGLPEVPARELYRRGAAA